MTRAERLFLLSLPAHMTAGGLSLGQAEKAIREAAREDKHEERTHELAQAKIEIQKMLDTCEQLLRLGLQEKALTLARDASTLSEGYKLAELREKVAHALKQCRHPGALAVVCWRLPLCQALYLLRSGAILTVEVPSLVSQADARGYASAMCLLPFLLLSAK